MSDTGNKYLIKEYSDQLLKDWNQVLEHSDDSWMMHDMALCIQYGKRQQAANKSFIVYDTSNNKPIALLPLFIYTFDWKKIYRINKVYGESFYSSGPAIVNSVSEKTRREIIHFLGAHISQVCRENKVDICTLSSANLSRRCLNPFYNTNPWHELRGGWDSIASAYYYLDLSLPVDKLRANLEVRTRTIINKIEKEGTFVFKKADQTAFDDIWELFLHTKDRTQLPFHEKEELKWFWEYKHANIYIAYLNGKPASAINIAAWGDTGMYWSSYTNNEFVNTQIATYLLWYSILEIKKAGIIHFELGSQEFSEVNSKMDSIAKFKRSFGGYLRYKYTARLNRLNRMQRFLKFISDRL